MNKLISVIVPVYNSEKTIKKCLQSILNQSYSNYEILVIDNCSSDNSRQIIKEMQKEDKRIKYFFTPIKGVSNARNLGLSKATGFYISFVDSDDYISDDFFKELVNLIDEKDINLSMVNYEEVLFEQKNYDNTTKVDAKKVLANDMIKFILLSKSFYRGFTCNKLFFNSIIKDNKIRFSSELSYLEDMEFVINYLLQIDYTMVSNKKMYYYVQHDNSASRGLTTESLSMFNSIHKIEKSLPEKYSDEINYLYTDMYLMILSWSIVRLKFNLLKELRKVPFNRKKFISYKKSFNSNFKNQIKLLFLKLYIFFTKGVML